MLLTIPNLEQHTKGDKPCEHYIVAQKVLQTWERFCLRLLTRIIWYEYYINKYYYSYLLLFEYNILLLKWGIVYQHKSWAIRWIAVWKKKKKSELSTNYVLLLNQRIMRDLSHPFIYLFAIFSSIKEVGAKCTDNL